MTNKPARAVAAERTRVARELHDVVGHGVTLMVVQAGAGRRVVSGDPERAAASFCAIEETGRRALGELDQLLGILRPHREGGGPIAPTWARPARRPGTRLHRRRPARRGSGRGPGHRPAPDARGRRLPRRPRGAHQHLAPRRPGHGHRHAALRTGVRGARGGRSRRRPHQRRRRARRWAGSGRHT
ncbi:MAG: histidine kinase dimerization/phosphoacceptor domain-containing protein [Actinobacteria bacterium]|nr:histidine kinase dimerization/phosphoacceptor domain-containing protein [Actinomycetota bacterium]